MMTYPTFTFDLPTKLMYGFKINDQLPKILGDLGIKHPMIVTDQGVRKKKLIDDFTNCLKDIGLPHEIFDSIEPNPKDYNVDHGVAEIIKYKCDGIITIGGGSPMDCAKAMAAVATVGGHARDYAGKGRIQQTVLPIIAVPTTAGTGSEVTFGAVITDSDRKFKFTIKGTSLAPKVALIDPGLTASMPPDLTAATGMDALTHAVEAYTAKNAHAISDAFALSSIDLIWTNLPVAFRQGTNIEARTGMLIGSLMAGIAFSHSDVGAVHCIAEALGGMYDIPHGVCNAVMLPTIMKYNLPFCKERYARIATVMGLEWENPETGAQKAVQAVTQMAVDVGLPQFSSFGINPKDFRVLAINSAENGSNPSNARPMTHKDYETILNELHGS
ncbi:MAG: iron-containing alcohol dehydrogenase [candidate division WOR-3 bacterium]